MKRDKLIEAIRELPQEIELEELMERLIFEEKIEKGLIQLEQGSTTDHSKVKELVKKW
ncbi:MAG TPA: hypothetical protein PKJ83_00195 [Cyclobacteriaceae bacterium]|nr:hypothetical protein [Cyclobacteriaceae bacterium]HPW60843.1 hypothetical protein [Cyclobacteriaceae bacterium]HRG80198.1 hypothetical protein [Cyclobacteriaceae bacterium]